MKLFASLGLGAFLLAMAVPAWAGNDPEGVWIMKSGKVTVKVSQCGDALCATIVDLKERISKVDGKPKVDRENPDPTLRQRPVIGLSILSDMRATGDGKWAGSLYNPDDGNTYAATVRLDGDVIKVRGCVLGLLCKTNVFERVN